MSDEIEFDYDSDDIWRRFGQDSESIRDRVLVSYFLRKLFLLPHLHGTEDRTALLNLLNFLILLSFLRLESGLLLFLLSFLHYLRLMMVPMPVFKVSSLLKNWDRM